jgi:hypothetical protein
VAQAVQDALSGHDPRRRGRDRDRGRDRHDRWPDDRDSRRLRGWVEG